MPRPRKFRRISFIPGTTYFKPAGIPMRFLEEVSLTFEETEAIRLKDIEDLDQEGCAERMNVSRPTAQRIIESARKKMAEALLNGKAIRIVGGTVEMLPQHYVCEKGHEWDVPLEQAAAEPLQACPVCNSTAASVLPENGLTWRGGGGRGGGRCRRRGFNR
ncbi:MAG: DUF134 domain-containing protein [Dehalococcoidia bacterium]|nr:DUF134 domain-containing protein [Dehalococcoidia bacterium]